MWFCVGRTESRKAAPKKNRYTKLIAAVFFAHHREGLVDFVFERRELVEWAEKLDIALPKNLGDIVYSFRYRIPLPGSIRVLAPAGKDWIILPAGRSKYRFTLTELPQILPNPNLVITKIPDSTPGVIVKYSLTDEQALLAKLRYNRLIDIFTGTTCYSLQSHLRTSMKGTGQIETDEVYVGLDRRGVHYVYPVQAKGGNDRLSVVQVMQDLQMCAEKFHTLVCRPIAAQFMTPEDIALFEMVEEEGGVKLAVEKHYRLVPPDELSNEDLRRYSRLKE